jgi:hypothetical protein
MSRLALMKSLLVVVCAVILLVTGGAFFEVLPARAAVLLSALSALLAVALAYITNFRGPEICLKLAPAVPFAHMLVSGYSNGLPSTWNIVVNLLASNDGPRPGALTGFGVDRVEYVPHELKAFTITFTSLEWQKAPAHMSAYSYVLPLPLLLPPQAREKVLFRAMLTFTGDPPTLADDLRELHGAKVRFHYTAGTEDAPNRRTGEVELTCDEVRTGVRAYWQGVQQYQPYVKQLDGLS